MNQFLTDKYTEIVKMAEKITQSRDYEEVAHYVIAEFMSHPRAQELIDKGEAMKFISGMIWRSYKSSSSPYHKLYRQSGRVWATDDTKVFEREQDEYDYDQDRLIDAIQGIIEDMHGEGVHWWYCAVLFQMYQETPNFSELSRKTLIPRTSIAHAVREAEQYIKQRLIENGIIDTDYWNGITDGNDDEL